MISVEAPVSPAPSRSESYSSISTYESCPLRYRYRYVDHLPGEVRPAQFAFGSAIHRALEAYGRGLIAARRGEASAPGLEVLWTAFIDSIETSGCSPDEIASFSVRARPVLGRFLELEAASDGAPICVETGFGVDVEVPGDVPVRFVGIIDRIDSHAGSTEVIDYKTGRTRAQACVDADLQLTAYAFALARGGLRDPSTGGTVGPPSRLALYFLDEPAVAWTTRSAAQLAAFADRLVETVRRVRAGLFCASPAPATCGWCEYRATCPDVVERR